MKGSTSSVRIWSSLTASEKITYTLVLKPKAEMNRAKLTTQDVVPYIISDWISFLLPSIAAPTVYLIFVYFMVGLRPDNIAANVFTLIADVSALLPKSESTCS
jgi:hypothetical protein